MGDYFSEIECGCGCGNLLPRNLTGKGWRYLRSHKPKGVVAAPQTAKPRAPRAALPTSTTPAAIVAFLRAQVALVKGQLAAARELHAKLTLDLENLRVALERFSRVAGEPVAEDRQAQ